VILLWGREEESSRKGLCHLEACALAAEGARPRLVLRVKKPVLEESGKEKPKAKGVTSTSVSDSTTILRGRVRKKSRQKERRKISTNSSADLTATRKTRKENKKPRERNHLRGNGREIHLRYNAYFASGRRRKGIASKQGCRSMSTKGSILGDHDPCAKKATFRSGEERPVFGEAESAKIGMRQEPTKDTRTGRNAGENNQGSWNQTHGTRLDNREPGKVLRGEGLKKSREARRHGRGETAEPKPWLRGKRKDHL